MRLISNALYQKYQFKKTLNQYFDNQMHYNLMNGLCRFIQFVILALLTLTVFTILGISMREFKIHSIETVSEVRHELDVEIVTYIKRKT